MALEITIGPPQLAISQGHTILLTDRDGQVPWPTSKGLYFRDTRVISMWQISANGVSWDLLNSGNLSHHATRAFLINRIIPTQDGEIPANTVGLALSRSIDGGVHEDIDLINHGMRPVRFNLEFAIRSDFADLFEVKSGTIVRRGRITTEWSSGENRLRNAYRNKDFCREVVISPHRNPSSALYANGRISFDVTLAPEVPWHTCLHYDLRDGESLFPAPPECIEEALNSRVGKRLQAWQRSVLDVETDNQDFNRLFDQAVDDLSALRLPIKSTSRLEFVPAAGVPWFVALFGRDSLIASLQTSIVCPEFGMATLDALARWQSTELDDYRDAEPGKIMHELRLGELAHFKLIPHTPYYGTADATMLYLIVLHETWRTTGDARLLERHLDTAERCLDWIDKYGDRDGDGYQEYQTRSSAGYENQGWKDAGDAVLYPDGSPVKGPKALCELQGYVYDAWLRMAEIFDVLARDDRAKLLRMKAKTLFRKFNEDFWDEDTESYAYALDGDKHKVLTVASNQGHCLWSGIVPKERAFLVVRQLMRPEMRSGWGIRTLSSAHPAYNPFSYQNGSIWPHDNSIIALGLRRYGFVDEAMTVIQDICAAASFFVQHQMPELYAGVESSPVNFPVQYLGANVPQAWAAGSVFAFLQVLVGFQPDAPGNYLYIDPALPDWLPEVRIRQLRFGRQSIDLHLWREGNHTRWKVEAGEAEIVSERSLATGARLPRTSLSDFHSQR